MPDEPPKDDIADLIYRIDPDEVPLLAAEDQPRALTEDERERIVSLFLHKKWRKLRRFAKRLDRDRAPRRYGANQVLTEWLVQELNPAADNAMPKGFTVQRADADHD